MRTKVKREYKERVDTATFLTAEEYEERHKYCINKSDIAFMAGISPYMPQDLRAVCDHERDGICLHGKPTPEQLAEINGRLSGTETPVKRKRGRPPKQK